MLIQILDELRILGEIHNDNVMEICGCSDSGARKYLAELFAAGVIVKLRCAWVHGGSFGPRVYGLSDDKALVEKFIAEHSPQQELQPLTPQVRTITGYPADAAKAGVFAQFQHKVDEVAKVQRDELVAALFGPAGTAA